MWRGDILLYLLMRPVARSTTTRGAATLEGHALCRDPVRLIRGSRESDQPPQLPYHSGCNSRTQAHDMMVIGESSMAADALEIRIAHLEGVRADRQTARLARRPNGVPRAHGERADRSRRAKAGCHLPLGDWHRPGQLDHPHARYISAPVTGRPHVDYSRRPQGVDRHSQRTSGACPLARRS